MAGNKNIKYWKRRFGQNALPGPYVEHLDLRPIDDLDDTGFAYLISHVNGINMLDLNETEISNSSIALLPPLEYIKELRLKGCRINNDCIADIHKIKGLEFLQVKDTFITIDGLLNLPTSFAIKELHFLLQPNRILKLNLQHCKNYYPIVCLL
jgi:hypothetical protein